MNDRLLDIYEKELAFIKDEAREFARRNPKIAGRLRINEGETVEDPHVSRLVEAFALLTARLRLKLEDEFPEVWQAMLSTLFPQYLSPVPAFSICEMRVPESAAENPTGVRVGRKSRVEVDTKTGERCRLRTCYDTQLFPIKITKCEYLEPAFDFEMPKDWKFDIRSAIRLRIEADSEKLPLSQLHLQKLRLFLGESDPLGNLLYEQVMRDCLSVGVFTLPKEAFAFFDPKTKIQPVGYADDEALWDHDPRTRHAFRLLWEFFVYSKKFRFVDLDIGDVWKASQAAKHIELIFYFRNKSERLQREVRIDTIRLGCTPVINLFNQSAETVFLSNHQAEYHVVPESNHMDKEVMTIDEVVTTSIDGAEQIKYEPFYYPRHEKDAEGEQHYWHSSRRKILVPDEDHDLGTDVFITLVDLKGKSTAKQDWTLHVQTTCCNRDLVKEIPDITPKGPVALIRDVGGGVRGQLISQPTLTKRPLRKEEYYWRLVSHLNLNHLSLIEADGNANGLREILKLYNFSDTPEATRAIQGVVGIGYERSVARVSTPQGVQLCRGIDIELKVEKDKMNGVGLFLFSSVLDRVFSSYVSLNSFTRFKVIASDHEAGQEPLYLGPPRIGERILL